MNKRQRRIARIIKCWIRLLEEEEPYSRLKKIATYQLAVTHIPKSKRKSSRS